jgi:hypothetical protein
MKVQIFVSRDTDLLQEKINLFLVTCTSFRVHNIAFAVDSEGVGLFTVLVEYAK